MKPSRTVLLASFAVGLWIGNAVLTVRKEITMARSLWLMCFACGFCAGGAIYFGEWLLMGVLIVMALVWGAYAKLEQHAQRGGRT